MTEVWSQYNQVFLGCNWDYWQLSDPLSMTMNDSIWRRKRLLFSVWVGSVQMVFSLVENTGVRLKLSSWAVVSPSLCNHLCTMVGITLAEESSASLRSWLRVCLSLSCCEEVLISGALGMFPAYAEIAPLRRSLVNIQKRKRRSIASIWSSAGVLISLICRRTAGPQDALGFSSKSSVVFFFPWLSYI